MSEIPESDRLEGCLHPRQTPVLLGQDPAQKRMLDIVRSGKMAHAWLLTGPEGVGKATFAYHLSRFLFKHPRADDIPANADTLHVSPDDRIFHQVAALGATDLMVLRPGFDDRRKRLRSEITVNEVRQVNRFFNHTAGSGGWRICIIDNADQMNVSAANAVLKILEEPPGQTLFLLISHTPNRLLPTIRSRCSTLVLDRLAETDIARIIDAQQNESLAIPTADRDILIRLAAGSAGRALMLAAGGGAAIYRDIQAIMSTLPRLDLAAGHALADRLGRHGADRQFDLFFSLLMDQIAAMLRGQITGQSNRHSGDEEQMGAPPMTPSASRRWSGTWQKIMASRREAKTLNLNRKQLVLSTLFLLEETASAR